MLTFSILECNNLIDRVLEDNVLSVCMELEGMRVFLDISRYWLKDGDGNPKSVNSVYEEIRGTPDEVGRNTLRLALEGTLDRGHFSNLIKLARLCSRWAGKTVTASDLLRVEDD